MEAVIIQQNESLFAYDKYSVNVLDNYGRTWLSKAVNSVEEGEVWWQGFIKEIKEYEKNFNGKDFFSRKKRK